MPMPRSVTRRKRNGQIRFISNVEPAKYTLRELTRAALRDSARVLMTRIHAEVEKIAKGKLKKSRRVGASFQYWIRKIEMDLLIGIKHNTWYGVDQELGTKNQPKREIMRKTVIASIDDLKKIADKYLQKIEDEQAANRVIDESEVKPGAENA
jgi:HK97 gp10 family phage protein